MKTSGWVLIGLGIVALIVAAVLAFMPVDATPDGNASVDCGSVAMQSSELEDARAADTPAGDVIVSFCDGARGDQRRLVAGAGLLGLVLVVVGVIVGRRRPAAIDPSGEPEAAA